MSSQLRALKISYCPFCGGPVGYNDLKKCHVCTRCGREFKVELIGRI